MKITKVKTARIGAHLILRVATDKGIDGYSAFEAAKTDYIGAAVPLFEQMVLGCDPTDVNDIVQKIRRQGAFKPWGAVASSIEMACWDVAGKEFGVPVYKLLGGKVRDRVRVYNGLFQTPAMYRRAAEGQGVRQYEDASSPEAIGESMLRLREMPEGISACKLGIGWHGSGFWERQGVSDYAMNVDSGAGYKHSVNLGNLLTEKGLDAVVDYVRRIKSVVRDEISLAVDCGPGFSAVDALRFAKAMEEFRLMWMEDSIAGDYVPYTFAHVYRDLTMQTTTPIHTGEQIYLRENFRELIEGQCVNVVGPDPADVGGISELKWIAEYANLHGIHMAPHGTLDGVFGLAALTQVCATMPANFIAYELPGIFPEWWFDIIEGLPEDYLRGGYVRVWDRPGIGVDFNVPKAEKRLSPEDRDFFL